MTHMTEVAKWRLVCLYLIKKNLDTCDESLAAAYNKYFLKI